MSSKPVQRSDLLIFVVGTSGSGKDSVMRETITYLQKKGIPTQTLVRVITRQSDKHEESIFMTNEAFLEHREDFALSWQIYANLYGCSWKNINKSIKNQEILLINVSRGVLHQARRLFPNCKIVLITVPKEIAEKRLKQRGREDQRDLKERVTRMKIKVDMPPPDVTIENAGDLDEAVQELGKYLSTLYYSVINS